MRKQPLSYTKQFLFVLSFNVAPYFQLKILFFLFNISKESPFYSNSESTKLFEYNLLTESLEHWTWNPEKRASKSRSRLLFGLGQGPLVWLYKLRPRRTSSKWVPGEIWGKTREVSGDLPSTRRCTTGRRGWIRRSVPAQNLPLVITRISFKFSIDIIWILYLW